MSVRYLLDTNFMIEILRGRDRSLAPVLSRHEGYLGTSTISVSELHYGIERSSRPGEGREAVSSMLALLQVMAFDEPAAEHAAQIRATLAGAGTPIGAYNTLIAGHARSAGLVVVTNNVKEFERVPGLLVEDWTRQSP